MLEEITYYSIFGKPLVFYLGISALLSLVATAGIGFANARGWRSISFKWHVFAAFASVILALVHGLLALLAYF